MHMSPSDYIRSMIPPTPKVEIKGISHWFSGEAAFIGLKEAVDELSRTAPEDHDVLIEAFNLSVREIRYIEPHTFLFSGINNDGHNSFVVCHYSQLLAHVIYRPKIEKERIITGFSRQNTEE
jgi:hypothetical protein